VAVPGTRYPIAGKIISGGCEKLRCLIARGCRIQKIDFAICLSNHPESNMKVLKTKFQGIFLVLEIARFDGSEPPTFLNSVMPNSGLGFEVFEPSKSHKGNREELESSKVDTRKPSKTAMAQPAFYIAFHLIQKRSNSDLEIARNEATG